MIINNVPDYYGNFQVAHKNWYTDERYPSNSKVKSE